MKNENTSDTRCPLTSHSISHITCMKTHRDGVVFLWSPLHLFLDKKAWYWVSFNVPEPLSILKLHLFFLRSYTHTLQAWARSRGHGGGGGVGVVSCLCCDVRQFSSAGKRTSLYMAVSASALFPLLTMFFPRSSQLTVCCALPLSSSDLLQRKQEKK